MKKIMLIFAVAWIFLPAQSECEEPMHLEDYTGVVTFHLIPAKVIKINKIIENPEPGTSNISDEGILFDLEENPNVMANWTVLKIKYFQYHQPKTIKYKILSEEHEIMVNYHAVSVTVAGDLSKYLEK